MKYWKKDDFTKAELMRVDQEMFEDELYVLRHSPAAREVFAKAQYYLAIDEHEWYGLAMDLFGAIAGIAHEVAHLHLIAYHRWNPWRKWAPSAYDFFCLAKTLGFESMPDEWHDETLVRTINGWTQV